VPLKDGPLTGAPISFPQPTGGGGGGVGGIDQSFSVNAAGVDGLLDGSVVLRTGARVNGAGAFVGGGTGNKSILGISGFDQLPLGDLESVEYVWSNVDGPGGPFFIPPGGMTVLSPYVNLVVDFDPLGLGDIRVLVTNDDSLNAAITAAIGTYVNNGSNVLTYSWDDTMDVLIVNAPPTAVPGGVAPNVTVGPLWPENSYSWAALVAANPDAVLVDAYPADGGLPAGAIVPAVLLVSGDSINVTRSGKRLASIKINGVDVLTL
jgi:hypothetical protein